MFSSDKLLHSKFGSGYLLEKSFTNGEKHGDLCVRKLYFVQLV